jgi:transposase
MKTPPIIVLTDEERETLHVWLRLHLSDRLALHAKIVLFAADGESNQEIARQLQTSPKTVSLWRRRFAEGRLAGIEKEAPRRKSTLEASAAMVRLIVRKTTNEPPPTGTHWTTRTLAKELGISPSLVQRVWKAKGLNLRQG